MNTYFKTLLLTAAVAGLSRPSSVMADFRDYNNKAWAQAGRSSSRSMAASRTYRAYRGAAPMIVPSEPAPNTVAQAPTERRAFSYEPSETAQSTAPATSGGGCKSSATSASSMSTGAQVPQTERRSYSYEPSLPSEPRYPSYGGSAARKKAAWEYSKADPRRYRP